MITELETPSMYGYIKDGGNALRNTFAERAVFCKPFAELMAKNNFKKVLFVGSGTSYNASLYITTMLERFAPLDAEAAFPTQIDEQALAGNGAYDPDQILVVGVSQSGTSVSTIDVMRRVRAMGCTAIALTDNLESEITEVVDHSIRLITGAERVHVETRGYIVSLFQGYLLALETGHVLGRVSDAAYAAKLAQAETFANGFDRLIEQADAWYDAHADELIAYTRAYVCTYGINECTAEEAELKLNETYHRPVRGYEMEEMIHGPHYALDEDNFSFFVAPDGPGIERIPAFLDWYRQNEITEHVFVVTSGDHDFGPKSLCFDAQIPEELSPIAMVLPFHIIGARNCITAHIDTAERPANRTSFAHLR